MPDNWSLFHRGGNGACCMSSSYLQEVAMRKICLPFSVCALAVLGACATSDPVTPAPAPVVVTPAPVVSAPPATVVVPQVASAPAVVLPTPTAIRAGFGRLESITAAPQSAAAGGATLRRFGIKMDDGTVQYVDTAAQGYSIGDRIELTKDGHIKRA
jgi:hypothetical protein